MSHRRAFSAKIVLVVCLFVLLLWSLVIFSKLEVTKELRTVCRRCRTMNLQQVEEYSKLKGELVNVNSFSYELPLYVKQFTMVEDGKSIVHQDQYAYKSLLALKSIRKTANNVFFVEGSCEGGKMFWENTNGYFVLNPSQSCGVESMALANPHRPVYILYTCPLVEDFTLQTSEYMRALLELPNVFIVPTDFAELSDGWPDPLPFSSVSVGLLALWLFGGTYSALDVLVLRDLDPLGTDYCGFGEDAAQVGSGFFSFQPYGYGNYLVGEMLRRLSEEYDSGLRVGGDYVLPRTVNDECDKEPMMEDDCNALTVYESRVLFPVGPKFTELLKDKISYRLISMIKSSAYVMNFFSSQGLAGFEQEELFTHSYFSLASEFCPKVYSSYNSST